MSLTKRRVIRSVNEATQGTVPTNPIFQSHCTTNITMAANPQTQQSEKVCGGEGRDVQDLQLFGFEPGGGWEFELTFGDQDELFPSLFQNAWNTQDFRSNRYTAAAQITTVDASADTIAITTGTNLADGDIVVLEGFTNDANNGVFMLQAGTTATSLAMPDGSMVAETAPTTAEIRRIGVQATTGDIEMTTTGGNALTSTALDFEDFFGDADAFIGAWIYIGGIVDDNQFDAGNGYARISGVSATRLDLDVVPTGFAADAAGAKDIRLFFGDFIRNGVTEAFYAVQDAFLDHDPVSLLNYLGSEIDGMELTLNAKSFATGSFTTQGLAVEDLTTQYTGATVIPVRPNDSFTTGSSISNVSEGGVPLTGQNVIQNISLSINNNSSRQNALGVDGSAFITEDFFTVTGTLDGYFNNLLVRAKITGNTESSLSWAHRDNTGHAFVYDMPRIKYTDGDPTNQNPQVMLPAGFQALRNDNGYSLGVTRFWGIDDTAIIGT